ncbi:MAG TPA: DUF4231 domain-containing protein [Thermoanaerobaculia bacterium]
MSSDEKSTAMLEEAWRRFAVYDFNANRLQRGFLRMRGWIATLGVLATLAAVLYAVVSHEEHLRLTDWRFYLRLLVLATPITASVLVAMTARIDRGVAWVMVRGSAEALKREIYRYRARVGPYGPERADAGERERRLAGKIESITRRLASSEALRETLRPYRGTLPPPGAAAAGDDGFSELAAEPYVAVRLHDQLGYYNRKSRRLERHYKVVQWTVVSLGGVGTFLAAAGLEIWVPVSISLGAALAGYLELRNVETTLASYVKGALELENVLTWWKSLAPEERAEQAARDQLVAKTEAVLQSENVDWQLEMQEALEELRSEERVSKKLFRAAVDE